MQFISKMRIELKYFTSFQNKSYYSNVTFKIDNYTCMKKENQFFYLEYKVWRKSEQFYVIAKPKKIINTKLYVFISTISIEFNIRMYFILSFQTSEQIT